MSKKLILTLVKTVLPLLLGSYLIWFSFSNMLPEDKVKFYKYIKEANYFWIFMGLIVSFIAFLSRAYRWNFALEPLGFKTKFWNRYHAIMIGYLMNLTIPRAGEASRAAMLYRSDGVPFSTSFGSIIAERAVDFIVLVVIGTITAFLGYNDFFEIMDQIKHYNFGGSSQSEGGFPWKLVIMGVISLGALAMAYLFIAKPVFRSKLIGFARDVFAGLFSIFRLKNPLAYLVHTLLIWICYILMFALPFYSLEITSDFPTPGIFLGFIAGSLGIILTNGGIGTYPILVSLVVTFYMGKQFPGEDIGGIGIALGWIIWLSQTLLLIILGLVSLVLLPKNYTVENAETSIHTSETSNDI